MRIKMLAALPVLAALALAPVAAHAQVSATIHLGPAVSVHAYSSDVHGDWHTQYKHWSPVTLYAMDGHYYSHAVKGGRAVQVYHSSKGYFFPPQDKAWDGMDKRYNYKRRPTDDDYSHAGH